MIVRSIGGESTRVLQALQEQLGGEYLYAWNSYNHGESWALAAFAESVRSNRKVICAETPLIGRSMFDQGDPNSYYRIGVNAVSTQQYKNFGLPDAVGPARLQGMLDKTDTQLRDWRSNGTHILYAMQVPGDSSLTGLDIFAAAQYDLFQIRQLTDRPIRITMHPDLSKGWAQGNLNRNRQNYKRFVEVAKIVGAEIQLGGSHALLDDCWCVVCYTSGFGFDAIAAGIPVVALSNRSFIAPIAGSTVYDILEPVTPHTDTKIEWLSRVAYCQWTLDEIKSGDFLEHFRSKLS